MSVVVVATIQPLPEHRADVVAAYTRAIARVHFEDAGCELYALHESDSQLVMIEKWTSAEALDAHSRSAAINELNSAIAGKLQAPVDVQSYTGVLAGDPGMGQL